jgi:hypothetical protein
VTEVLRVGEGRWAWWLFVAVLVAVILVYPVTWAVSLLAQ